MVFNLEQRKKLLQFSNPPWLEHLVTRKSVGNFIPKTLDLLSLTIRASRSLSGTVIRSGEFVPGKPLRLRKTYLEYQLIR